MAARDTTLLPRAAPSSSLEKGTTASCWPEPARPQSSGPGAAPRRERPWQRAGAWHGRLGRLLLRIPLQFQSDPAFFGQGQGSMALRFHDAPPISRANRSSTSTGMAASRFLSRDLERDGLFQAIGVRAQVGAPSGSLALEIQTDSALRRTDDADQLPLWLCVPGSPCIGAWEFFSA